MAEQGLSEEDIVGHYNAKGRELGFRKFFKKILAAIMQSFDEAEEETESTEDDDKTWTWGDDPANNDDSDDSGTSGSRGSFQAEAVVSFSYYNSEGKHYQGCYEAESRG